MKNYVGFINDHSGSMYDLRRAAMQDYNTNIAVTKEAATREMLDTVVSVVGIGYPKGSEVTRQIVISNPHVLKPVTNWSVEGGTPLYDGIGNMIELFESLPDYSSPNVSFLVLVTTDGDEQHSRKYSKYGIAAKIETLQKTGRWTFVMRIPKGYRHFVEGLNIPRENIQEWETTAVGMEASTVQTTQAMNNYYAARSAGARSSTTFYSTANAVDTSKLKDITKEVSLYLVPQDQMGIEIRDFILKHRMEYLKGSAFYQLTKTEARVQHTKMILVRDRTTGAIYAGDDARKMIGLPTNSNARLHPGDHGNYDIFIQSESINRKLVAGTGVIYWKAIGKQFTQEELDRFKPKETVVLKPGVVELPKVEPTNKPTPSPIPKTKRLPMVDGKPVQFFPTRDAARNLLRGTGKPVKDGKAIGVKGPKEERWFAFV